MKFPLAVAAWFLFAYAVRGENYTVRVQESAIIELAGATAAYTTNPDIADVSLAGAGRVSVTGHSAGTTQLVVVTANGMQSFLIKVAAATNPSPLAPKTGVPLVRYEGRYSSPAGRAQNSVDVVTTGSTYRSELHVLHIHELRAGAEPSSDAIASIFYRHATPGREWTVLDEMVDVSGLTVSNAQVRGLHLRQGPLELHAGYASATMYDGFFLPSERRWVGGVGYGFDVRSTRWTPSVYGFFSAPEGSAARRGVVGALTAEHRRGENLLLRGEIAVSRSLAAAGEVRHASPRGQFHAAFSIKPDDFPTLGLADVRGAHAELDWSRRATGRLSITSRGTYDRFNLAALPQAIGSAGVGVGFALSPRATLHSGAGVSEVRTSGGSIRTIDLPFSLTYERPGFGVAASYRLLDHSAASRRGDSFRLSGHAGHGGFTGSLWGERQRQAPTLDLIFNSTPGLELALLRLGISVRTPEDVARALRDNAALIDLGFITGVNVDLTPKRVQAGLNLGWRGSGPRSNQLRFLAVYGRDEGVRTTRDSMIATLTYSRRVLVATDLYGSYSWWRTGISTHQESGTSSEIGLRQQFSGLPNFLRREGTIDGFVFLDPLMQGKREEGAAPLPDIVVTLDGSLTQRTDSKGAFAFHGVPPGAHRIAAQLPVTPRAFFTTPSQSETQASAHVEFGLVWAAARIDGRVVTDAGTGIPGLVLTAAAMEGPLISTTSDPEGGFAFAVPAGTFRVAVTPQSLPPGYSIAQQEKSVTVEPERPASVSFAVQVLRSVAGKAEGISEVRIDSLDRAAPVDERGNFLFRSMPSGTFTITARRGGRTYSATVSLPPEPAMIRDVILGEPQSIVASTTPAPAMAVRKELPLPRVIPAAPSADAFRVQAGAFRSTANAEAARRRIEKLGRHAGITRSGSLEIVTLGPFASRAAAEEEANRLQAAGVDAVLVADRVPSRPLFPLASSSHIVQAGAFRESRYAGELVRRLERSGEQPFTLAAHGLTLVYIGPFASRQDAHAANERLSKAGIAGFVIRR